jgi:hypothetical protein
MSDLLNSASLVLIPSGYKEDTVYSVVPSDGSGDLSFTRASNGTRVNSAGLVEVVAWNFNTNSEIFTTGWGADGTSTATDNFATAPNGTLTAAKVVANSANGYAYKNIPVLAPNTYTLSYYVKASASATISINKNDFGGSGTSGQTFTIGTEWQRIEFSFQITLGTLVYIDYADLQTGKTYYIWGAQVNVGATAKPYFPTTDRLNVPRLTYQNGGGGCPSLLLEKQSTNLITYSEQFDNAAWTKQNSSITANATTSPDGTQNADKFIASNANTFHAMYNYNAVLTGSYTMSVYAKKGEYDFLVLHDQFSGTFLTSYNLSTGAVHSGSGASIENVGNGWYRCIVTFNGGGTTVIASLSPSPSGSAGTTYLGDGTSGIFIWGAQLEASSYPTSYIPTTSSSATRVADACFKTGISSLIGQTEGVLFWDIEVETLSATGNENILNVDSGSFGNTMYLIKTSTGGVVAEIYVSNVAQCLFSYSLPSVGRYKMALAYKANDFAFYVNGVSRGTDSSGSVPTCSRLQLGNGVLGPSDGKTNQAIIFPTRLTNAELASLTTI